MATELRARGVPWEELAGILGHRIKGATEKYAKYDPNYLGKAAQAIDAYFSDLCVSLAWHPQAINDNVVSKIVNDIKGKIGAGEEDRTLDIHLGKVALYR